MIRIVAVHGNIGYYPIRVVRMVFGDEVSDQRSSGIANYHPDDLRELELLLEFGRRYEKRLAHSPHSEAA